MGSLRGSAAALADRLAPLSLSERLSLVRDTIEGRIVFTTSFGLEDQAISHAIFTTSLAIEVVTLDTGRLFPETYDLWAETEQRYGARIRAYAPDQVHVEALVAGQGINGFRQSVEARKACCGVRKVEPLGRALAGASAWITGLRSEQSAYRSGAPLAAHDEHHRLIKINAIVDWSRADVAAFVSERGIPYNPLHDRGFASIGCAPCTRALRLGEPERAGRWWWEQEGKQECGLHLPAAAAVPLAGTAGA